MILTGKAKEGFKKYARSKGLSIALQDLFLNSLIIEWLDSVGIYINTRSSNNEFMSYITNNEMSFYENTRQEATERAITKANEIYNEKNR